MAKRFINAPSDVVPDLMAGLSLDSSRVTLLDPATGHHVAVRAKLAANTQTPRVSVVSGGGSGHEPMAAGYVGDGMLAAAVAGGVFASPSVSSISAMLQAVAPRSTGILVVVMNYQGDRLNFNLAVRDLVSKSPGYPIHVMLVSDDVALPNNVDKRGIAGTIFVLKVAGAAADQGRPFQEVVNIAETAARSVVSYGVALEPCTIPGHQVDVERLSANEMELGMGIHGEAGAEKQILSQLDRGKLTRDLVTTICTRLDHAMHMKADLAPRCTGLAVMVNNLGAVSQAELLIVTKAVSDFIYHAEAGMLNGHIFRVHVFVGSFMTSLQMNGVSISCFMLPTDNGIMEQFLHAPTECVSWSTGFELFPPSRRTVLPRLSPDQKTGQPQQSRNVYFPTMAQPGNKQFASTHQPAPASAPAPVPLPQQPQSQQQQQQQTVPYTKPRPAQQFPVHANTALPAQGQGPSQTAASLSAQPKENTPAAQPAQAKDPQKTKEAPKVYNWAKARSGAASSISGLSPSTEMNILTITSSLQSHWEDLTKLDRKTGDGDLGDTVKRGCEKIRDDLEKGRYAHAANNPSELFKAIATSTEAMGGSSGVITRIFLLDAAAKFAELQRQRKIDSERMWRAAFVAGTKGVMEQGGARVGDRTMVDALKPAADVFEHGSGSVSDAADAARVGFESTKSMTKAKFGRSAHVRADKLLNQPDPGASAICIILESLIGIL